MVDRKKSIERIYFRCVDMLDGFDDEQITVLYNFLSTRNTMNDLGYTLFTTIDRISVLHFLIELKMNVTEREEMDIHRDFVDILQFMTALYLLKLEYKQNGKL